LNQEHLNDLEKSKMSKEIDAVIKSIPKEKNLELGKIIGKFYQTYKELKPMLLK
jgi:hypothetical protein